MVLVGFAGTDDAVVGPDGDAPLPFFHDIGIGFVDQSTNLR